VDARFADVDDLILPDTLQAAITNRIDSLDPAQQLTLKVASVIGRIFAFRVLQAVHPIEADKPALYDCLETLTRLSLTLVESEAPDLAYVFKHALTQEVAYNLMLFSQRRQLHQAVAEWIEKNYEKNLEAYYTILAHHWSQAAETNEALRNTHALVKALQYLDKAGEQAAQNYAQPGRFGILRHRFPARLRKACARSAAAHGIPHSKVQDAVCFGPGAADGSPDVSPLFPDALCWLSPGPATGCRNRSFPPL
jgi:hypothetical protein